MTPLEPVPLAGYGNTAARLFQTVLDPLYATCMAFEDAGGKRALLFTIDLIGAGRTCTTEIRPAISETTGIPVERIQCAATHTHAAPDTRSDLDSVMLLEKITREGGKDIVICNTRYFVPTAWRSGKRRPIR